MTDAEVERKLKKQRKRAKREAAGEKLIKLWVPVDRVEAVGAAILCALTEDRPQPTP